MKTNGNNLVGKEYYVGLDIGTSSVGFAVSDTDYNLKKRSGKSMWGVRLFEEGETAEGRRVNRTNRRRLARRNQRLELLRMLFDEEITKIDSGFFMRLKESFLTKEDKSSKIKYSLFADADFNDKDYMKKYPTTYHLRHELINSREPHDIRLVYLALRHIIKNRGHFLFEIDGEGDKAFNDVICNFVNTFNEQREAEIELDVELAYEILNKKSTKADKTKELTALAKPTSDNKKALEKLFALIVGGKAKISDIFETEEKTSFSFDMGDEKLMELEEKTEEDFELIRSAKAVYDCLILEKITKGYKTLSQYKIAEFNQHKEDIELLKFFVKEELKDKALYKEIFKIEKEKLTNYAAYSGYKKSDNKCHATQEEFCKLLKDKLPKEYETSTKYEQMYKRIKEGTFAPKLRKTENGVIPNGLHRSELVTILENASEYLSFLNSTDEEGITVKEKIISIFDFRIPYYVGPLKAHWAVRKEEGKIFPWNFEKKINVEASAEKFITEMTSLCTYTAEDVLPKNSLLYSEFEVLNEINCIKINGNPITVECKKKIFDILFVKSNKKVTKKSILSFLRAEGLATDSDEISGIDDNVKSQLTSYHKLKNIIEKTSYEQTEEIIRRIVLFGDDKKLLKSYLKSSTSLNDDDINYVAKQKFKDWGRLSKQFLNGIEAPNKETGELVTVIEMLRETNYNLMQILSGGLEFLEIANNYKTAKLGIARNTREMVDNLYVSPKIKRSIWQALRILDEIIDIEKGVPKRIFLEMARENESEDKKKANSASRRPRKEQLIELYRNCKETNNELFERLMNEDEEKLRAKKLYLYYLQFGKCMYSKEPIELSELDNNFKYDIDHIFPRSKIKDDSFNNLVLVKAELNREKTNIYPISSSIRDNMKGFWSELKRKGFISNTKYDRLVRNTPLSSEELNQFIQRQLVETRQSTKAVAELIKALCPKTELIYSKAGNVSEFRRYFDFTKCRDINDHHHAKDAYLNIVVGNFYNSLFTKEFAQGLECGKNSIREEVIFNQNLKGTWISGANGTIKTVSQTMSKNNVLFTVMPREEHGQLFDVTIMPRSKGQVPIKQGLDIDKYGGYNKAAGAYFAIVEHEEKGEKVRTVEAVLKHQRVEYEENPQSFAKKHWYANAEIIISKVLFNSVFELNGVRLIIRKRQNTEIGFIHTYQFVLNQEDTKYLKSIIKYVEACSNKKESNEAIKPVAINEENNVRLYKMFIERITNSVYKKLFSTVLGYLTANEEAFIKLSIIEQCIVLKEILKLFKCDSVLTSLDILCKKGSVGSIIKSKKLSSLNSAYLINQSVTGIFETKIDLLK
ncbi:MAG: type II CRISPR RNA-guided endonuclease Cas9 [Clostridia bacterium]|nr:type II CRISPR RNA-guided endonuclease Cas9 [Clostridia bacterium]